MSMEESVQHVVMMAIDHDPVLNSQSEILIEQ